MIGILLTILKVIGIILLSLIGLVLLILLLILFAPIRYRVKAKKDEEIAANVRVRWAFPLAQVTVDYNGELAGVVRVFGIPVYRLKPGGSEDDGETDDAECAPETEEAEVIAKEESETEPASTESTKMSEEAFAVDANGDLLHPEVLDSLTTSEESETVSETAKLSETVSEVAKTVSEDSGLREGLSEASKPNEDVTEAHEFEEDLTENASVEAEADSQSEDSEPEKKERFAAIKKLKAKATSYYEAAGAMKKLLFSKKEILTAYIKKDRTKRVGKLLWNTLLKILKHLCPKKLEGEITFGGKDPEMTGMATAAAGVLCPIYGDAFSFTPDFEQERIEGNVLIKGRIVLGVLAFHAILVWFNKDFKKCKAEAFRVKDRMAETVPEAKEIIANAA